MDSRLREIIRKEAMFASEAAEYLEISPQRLNQLVHSEAIKPLKRSKGGTLFLRSDLEKRKQEKKTIGRDIETSKNKSKFKINSATRREALNYFTIKEILNFTDKKAVPFFEKLKDKFDLTEDFSLLVNELSSFLGKEKNEIEAIYNKTLREFEKLADDDYLVKKGTKEYPSLLAKTVEAPPYLFMRGNIQLLNERIISIVGTRKPSKEGIEKAKLLAKLLGDFGIVVASGLANGIDTAAHRGTLENNKPTISVLGTPITRAYPRENAELQKQISEEGLIISQFPPSAKVQRWFFPLRNAVMSGISLATVVIEAGETSGALKQANYALKQNRILFIPKSALENENIKWPKKYIQRKGAKVFSKISELIEGLAESNIILETNKGLFSEGGVNIHVHRIE